MEPKGTELLLFTGEDFDHQYFDAAEFVAKYRRIITLESLREQLLAFSGGIQKELYQIINRDYKDFITISTKVVSFLLADNWLFSTLS